jgi:hypothetical protein
VKTLYERVSAALLAIEGGYGSACVFEGFKAEIDAMEVNSNIYLDQDASYYYQGKQEATA